MFHDKKLYFLISLALTSLLYVYFFSNTYRTASAYWVIKALIDLTFWTIAFYPNYSWSSMGKWRRVLLVGLCIQFCMCFMPVEVLINSSFSPLRMAVTCTVLLAILNDDDDDTPKKRRRTNKESKNRSKLKLSDYTT